MLKYVLIVFFYVSCLFLPVMAQDGSLLSADEFQEKIYYLPEYQLLDLRTSAEFQQSHIRKAKNIDYKNRNFEQLVQAQLDKQIPLFIYCFSGGRSAGAKTFLQSLGFEQVYELEGGFAQWTASSKPYIAKSTVKPLAAITNQDIHRALYYDEVVLLDFYAEWCGPCKKMNPILEKIKRENPRIRLLKIEADKNEGLANRFEVEEIPTYILFKKGKQVWRSTGIVPEPELRAVFRKLKL